MKKIKKDAFSILYTNADGLVNKIQELKVLVNSFTDRLQVIAVTETKPKHLSQQLLISEFHLQGYNTFSQDLDDPNKRGLLLYISSEIEASLVDIPSAFSECLFVILKSYNNLSPVLVGNIYRSPNSSVENDDKLYNLFKYIDHNFNIPKLIMGDFNFPNINWYPSEFGANASCSGLSLNEMRFVNSIRENSLYQHVVYPTRQRGSDTPHILDLVISSDNFLSDISHLSPIGYSDHCVLKFNCHLYIEQAKTKDKYNWNNGDYPKLIEYLNMNWDNILDPTNNSVDEMWEIFKLYVIGGHEHFYSETFRASGR